MAKDGNAEAEPMIQPTVQAGTQFLEQEINPVQAVTQFLEQEMNPVQKVVLITSLAASLITLIAQSAGGDLAALLTALAVSAAAPILLPRLFGMQIIMVDKEELAGPAGRSSLPPSATAELSVRAAKEGFKPTKEQYLEAMDKDIQNCVDHMDKIDDLPTKHMFATQVNKMRAARELINKADEKEF